MNIRYSTNAPFLSLRRLIGFSRRPNISVLQAIAIAKKAIKRHDLDRNNLDRVDFSTFEVAEYPRELYYSVGVEYFVPNSIVRVDIDSVTGEVGRVYISVNQRNPVKNFYENNWSDR